MRKISIQSFILFSLCLLFCSCGVNHASNSKPVVSPVEKDEVDENNLPEWFNTTKINYEVSEYLETTYRMDNFRRLDKNLIYLENSVIPYELYYLGECKKDFDQRFILVKLKLEPEQYTLEPNVVFRVNVSSEIQRDCLDDDMLNNFANDDSLPVVAEGTFKVGEAYKPEFKNFEGKESVLEKIKTPIRNTYFKEHPEPAYQPIFYGKTKAKEVYILDFDEGCLHYNRFAMIIYTENGKVYLAPLWYCIEDHRFYCDEREHMNEDVFLVSELEAAQDGELKEVADYCKRFKENAICKMTWDDSEETAK